MFVVQDIHSLMRMKNLGIFVRDIYAGGINRNLYIQVLSMYILYHNDQKFRFWRHKWSTFEAISFDKIYYLINHRSMEVNWNWIF